MGMAKKIIKDPDLLALIEECKILKEKISENAVEISNNISKTNVSYINKSSKTEVTVTKNEISRDMQN
jgi:hypothetical protein